MILVVLQLAAPRIPVPARSAVCAVRGSAHNVHLGKKEVRTKPVLVIL